MLRKSFAAAAAIAILAGSSAAVAQSAQPLSIAAASRDGAQTQAASDLDGRNGMGIYIIGAVVLGLIIWGIIELTDDGGPESP